ESCSATHIGVVQQWNDLAASVAFRTEGRILGWNQKSADRTESTGTEADKR
ncbi:hypothetical protein Tco_1567155, partial [Tanacetum coccineum]